MHMRLPKLSGDESAFFRRIKPHFATSLKALFMPLATSGIVLANGAYLEKLIDTSPDSILFRLRPFNPVYLQQFAGSPYGGPQIKWLFTVVSYSNAIWLTFICWKVAFELFRGDVEFPSGETPTIEQVIIRTLVANCVMVALFILVNLEGFTTQDSVFDISFRQSIAIGAMKVLIMMFFVYVAVAFIIEFSGLGLRYLLSKRPGPFRR